MAKTFDRYSLRWDGPTLEVETVTLQKYRTCSRQAELEGATDDGGNWYWTLRLGGTTTGPATTVTEMLEKGWIEEVTD